ncbi:hypothetical protein PSI23_09420 [Xenorhabdus sp. XENO-10]|uniref:Uncharacterized protein n=1 Tax=Xenorhabdus yunnanensis TaxID=3025878 RepID=A0ABT5LEI8_9GAMM|nr:hypothetical protein [Xenorhabdus yunnanensis]MDC9589523.1 hypothetical protein [Xenorhabdus yunnanensis]
MILAESPALIGQGTRGSQDMEEIEKINRAIHRVNPNVLILHGADATGSTSGIIKAEKPFEMMEKMIASVVAA